MPFDAPEREIAVSTETGAPSDRGPSAALRLLALAAALAAAGLAAALSGDKATGADPDLSRLIKGMAILKGVIAAAVAAAIGWRLTSPAKPAHLALYLASAAAMVAGVALMWRMAAPGAAATLYYAGLIAAIFLMLGDRTIIARIDAALVQRQALQARAEKARAPAEPE
jgi:hypothetical protein